jgi:hypothetical protein
VFKNKQLHEYSLPKCKSHILESDMEGQVLGAPCSPIFSKSVSLVHGLVSVSDILTLEGERCCLNAHRAK